MSEVVALVDYDSGNLHSAAKAFQRMARPDQRVIVTADPAQVARAGRIVLPGDGAFPACRAALDAVPGMVDAMTDAVLARGVPFMGICVGMQLLATRGHEYRETPGLGWIPGEVVRIDPADPALKVPHMGWNDLAWPGPDRIAGPGQVSDAPAGRRDDAGLRTDPDRAEAASGGAWNGPGGHPALAGLSAGDHAYFVHSWRFAVDDPAHLLASVDYGGEVAAIVGRDNILGCQFHPEKSQSVGLRLIGNFLGWRP